MTRVRLVVLGALLLGLLAAIWLWSGRPGLDEAARLAPPPAGAGTGPAAAAAAAAEAALPEQAARTALPAVGPAQTFEIRGRVLAEPELPVAGAEVVATRGRPGERATLMSAFASLTRTQGRITPADLPVLSAGTVLARATVGADGAFSLRVGERDVRLSIAHDYYGLPVPAIVHVPAATDRAEVVLAPYLGGCLRGHLLGGEPGAVRALRLTLQPDPLAAARDPQRFLGAILAQARDDVRPDPDGEFVFRAVLADAAFAVTAAGDTVAGRVEQPGLQPAELREVALPLRAAASLEVQVAGEHGEPVADARVTAAPAGVGDPMARETASVRETTGAGGAAILRGLLPGRYLLRATASGFASASTEVAVPETATAVLRLPRGGSVAGVVVAPGGAGVAGAKVAAMESVDVPMLGDLAGQFGLDLAARAAERGVPTDAEGRFTLHGIEGDDPFHVVAAHQGYIGGIARSVRAGAADVRVELVPGARVRGRVVADEDGAPLPSFTVELQAPMFLVLQRPVRTAALADAADGAFALDAVPPGSYTLVARADGRSERSEALTVAAGADVAAPALRLPRGASVRGVVRDPAGLPIARATVRPARGSLLDNPMLALIQGDEGSADTDDQGHFELTGLPPGRLQLVARARGWAGGKSGRLQLGAGAVLDGVAIVLGHGGSVAGTLRVGPGEHAEEFAILVQEVQSQRSTNTTPAADGAFRVDDLDPGRYQVQAMHPLVKAAMQRPPAEARPGRAFDFKSMLATITENIVTQRCTVRDGETTRVDLDARELGAGVRLTVRVRIGGAPLQSGLVEATQVEDGRVRTGFLGDGETTLGALLPGRLRVQVRAGMALTPVGKVQDVDVPAGGGDHAVTIDLPGGELRGRVVGIDSGQPLGAVLVRLLRDGAEDDLLGAAITDARGEFAFRALEPGTYGLVATDALQRAGAAGTASRKDGIRVAEGECVTGLELRAQPAAGVTVVVTGEAGAPEPGAMLLAVDAAGRPLGGLAVAGQDGRALLGGLPRGLLRVVGRAPGLAPGASDLVDVAPGEAVELPLQLRRGTLVVVDAVARDGRPLAGADVSARCGGGPWFPAFLLVEGRPAGGRLELGRLAPGSWEFRVAHPACGTFTVRRAIGDGAPVTILAMPP